MKSLGVYFGNETIECDKLNWDEKINSLNRMIDTYNKRNLTFHGKIFVIKTFLLPKLTYLLQNTVPPKTC